MKKKTIVINQANLVMYFSAGACSDQAESSESVQVQVPIHVKTNSNNDKGVSVDSKDIFISYSREPRSTGHLKKLKESLEGLGYSVWLDETDIPGGSDWHSAIGTALKHCKAVVALITNRYLSSKYCRNELYMGESLHKCILPVLLEDVQDDFDPGVHFAIASVNWIKAVDNFDVEGVVAQLDEGLKNQGVLPSLPRTDKKTLTNYSVDDVCALIESLEIDPEQFRVNSVGGEDLLELSEKDMKKELKLTQLQVKKVKRHMKSLLDAESAQ